jgi:hypothetical protein
MAFVPLYFAAQLVGARRGVVTFSRAARRATPFTAHIRVYQGVTYHENREQLPR